MNTLVRASLASMLIAAGMVAAGCPASPSSANAAVPAPASAPDSPEQVVLNVAHALSDGHPHVAWDALPTSYQQDLSDVIHAFAAKVDPEIWNQGFAIIRKAGDMLGNKKDIILAMPNFRESAEFDLDRISNEWDHVIAPFTTIADSELADVNTLRNIDIRDFLATTGAQFMNDLVRISEFAPEDSDNKFHAIGQTKATLVNREGDTATVEIQQPGEPTRTEQFVRVEGKWIPEEMANEWADQMREANERIAQMSPEKIQAIKPQVMTMLTSIETTIDQLNQSTTPEQFEQTAQMGMFQVFGGIMALARATDSDLE